MSTVLNTSKYCGKNTFPSVMILVLVSKKVININKIKLILNQQAFNFHCEEIYTLKKKKKIHTITITVVSECRLIGCIISEERNLLGQIQEKMFTCTNSWLIHLLDINKVSASLPQTPRPPPPPSPRKSPVCATD